MASDGQTPGFIGPRGEARAQLVIPAYANR